MWKVAFKKFEGIWSAHTRKKREDILETRAELAVLPLFVENQAILEPILLYRASKCKQFSVLYC